MKPGNILRIETVFCGKIPIFLQMALLIVENWAIIGVVIAYGRVL
jgi:hypothetical protein